MLKNRLYALLTLFITVGLQAMAESVSYVLIVECTGATQRYALSTRPTITFEGTTLNIQSATFSTAIVNVKKAYFEPQYASSGNTSSDGNDTPTNIENISTTLQYSFIDGKTFVVEGISDTDVCRVFSVSGMQMNCSQEYSGNTRTIHLDGCPAGAYIIKVCNQSFKILKK